MTDQILQQLQALEQQATKGPWEVFRAEDISIINLDGQDVCDVVFSEVDDEADFRKYDAELIAQSRNALQALLADAARLRTLDGLKDRIEQLSAVEHFEACLTETGVDECSVTCVLLRDLLALLQPENQ